MPYADWEIVKSNAGLVAVQTTTSPLVGVGSLRVDNDAIKSSATSSSATARPLAAFHRGFTRGYVRTLVQALDCFPAATGEGLFGALAMMNQADVRAAGGTCYAAGIWFTTTPEWRIVRFDNGIGATGTATVLASGDTTNTPDEDETHALKFQWNLDAETLGGVQLILSVGTTTDFSDLVQIYSYEDTSASYLTSSVGEGLIFIDFEGSGDRKQVYYDETRTRQLT